MAPTNSRNNFGLLSSSQEPSQLIAQATSTAKNRKKKEKAKGKKAASLTEASESNEKQHTRDSHGPEKQAAGTTAAEAASAKNNVNFDTLQRQFVRDAQNRDCWSVWDEWLKQAKSENQGLKYSDGKANSYTFQQALASSSALPRSVANAVYCHMTPSDRDLLTTLLKLCLPAAGPSSKNLAMVVSDVSEQLENAPNSTKDAAAAALERTVKSFVRACEATADSGMPDLDNVDKEIAAKQPVLQKAISQPDTVQTSTVDMAMQVVQLLHRRYEGEQCLAYGLAPSICAAAKADTEHLASILTQHACASPAPAAAAHDPSANAEVERAITGLSQRIASLEAELAGARAELREAHALRMHVSKAKGGAGGCTSPSARLLAAKQASQQLQNIVMEVARLPAGVAKNGAHTAGAPPSVTDSTLMQLLDFSTHTAQMQDKLMDKLAEQLEFARARLVSAANMKSESGITNARKLFSNVRAASSEMHDSAARLEALVASLESAISSSPSFSTLRPMAMQVKQIAWQVYNSHNHLSANARPDAILEATSTTKGTAARSITLDEILQMDVGGKGATQRQQQQPTSAPSVLPGDPTATASRAATQGSSPAPSTAPQQHSVSAASPPVPVPMPTSMPADNPVHAALVYGAPLPAQQGAPMSAGFMGAPQPMHAMMAQPAVVVAGGMLPQQAMPAQPAQPSMPLQQFSPGQLFAQDAAQAGGLMSAQPAAVVATSVAEVAPSPASRFDSQIAAAEAAAANLAKVMASKPAAGRGGRTGAARRGGGGGRGRS